MKHLKKIASLVLALAMALALAIPAMAADTYYSITINNSATGHTYEAYQIFTGDLATKDGKKVLSNIVWGSGISETGQTALQNKYDTATTKSAAGVAEALTDANAVQFAKDAAGYLTTTKVNSTYNGTNYTISGLEAGYYLVKDKDSSLNGADDAYTAYILQVVGNTSVAPKSSVPTVEKKVKDINDSTDDDFGDWQDSADYDIGDTIPYQLTATMGDLSGYDHYYVEFVDTMTHLTYTGITSVKVGDTTLSADQYTADWDGSTKTLKVVITDVKAYGAKTGTKVVVEYTATLDAGANIGSAGNPNEVYLVYSNNPNNTGDGTSKPSDTGETPKDKNIVFTYKVVVNKVDGENKSLAGAEFTLEKYNKETDKWETIKVVKNDEGTTFTFSGLDDGNYRLTETKTPDGYNTIAPIEFTIVATHNDTGVTSLTGTNEKLIFTPDTTEGSLSADVVNNSGATLPETGGIGTTIFYVVGGILVIGAGVVLVTKKRMG